MMKISVREREREEDDLIEDLELERAERLLNDEVKGWEEGFEEGYFSEEDLL